MRAHLVTVCVFCLLCAAHTPCSAHQVGESSSPLHMGSKGTVLAHDHESGGHANAWDDQIYIKKMFNKFSDGKTLDMTGFENLLKAVNLRNLLHVEETTMSPQGSDSSDIQHVSSQCVGAEELVQGFSDHDYNGSYTISATTYQRLCPVLLFHLAEPEKCVSQSDLSKEHSTVSSRQVATVVAVTPEPVNTVSVWLYATLSIIIISLCGLLGVAVIPVMQMVFYQQLLQFLVALAVGTLCGDALLHLLPHAMMAPGEEAGHTHSHSHEHGEEDPHSANMWKGFVTSLGVVFFFFTEKCLTMCAEWRKRRQRKSRTPVPKVRVMRDTDDMNNSTVGEKLCKHKYSSYPYCYGDITKEDTLPENNFPNFQKIGGSSACQRSSSPVDPVSATALTADHGDSVVTNSRDADNDIKELRPEDNYTIIIREHKNHHHGHSHTHGHVHSAPHSLSSVAWMVIMGDGLHNFTDGMAIGAAFAANIAGGFSTAVAVFCHELPHELGDFAVLLKAGMSAKQAVFYNLLSSVLCFFGMCLGIFLGNTETASQWIFAVAAGMFLYIALVDMIPELSTSHSMEGGSLCQCLLQLMGLMTGIGIMLLIANYEHDLKRSFSD